MRLSTIAGLCLATVATVQAIREQSPNAEDAPLLEFGQDEVPSCALECIDALAPRHGCDATDTACTCASEGFKKAAAECIPANCTVREALTARRLQAIECDAPVRDRTHEFRRIAWALFTLAVIFAGLRICARSKMIAKDAHSPGFWWDDWVIFMMVGLLLVMDVLNEILLYIGLGWDFWMVPFPDITKSMLASALPPSSYFWIEQLIYAPITNGVKISLCLLYLRIFPATISRNLRVGVWVLIGVLAVRTVAVDLSIVFQCTPVNLSWLGWDQQHAGHCISRAAQGIADGVLNIFFDLAVMVLPIPPLLKLKMSRRRKASICVTFLMGFFVTACSVVRVQYISLLDHSDNPTWDHADVGTWSSVECHVGVICTCIPPISGLINRVWVQRVMGHSEPRTDDVTLKRVATESELRRSEARRSMGRPQVQEMVPGGRVWPGQEGRLRLDSDDEARLVGKEMGVVGAGEVKGYDRGW